MAFKKLREIFLGIMLLSMVSSCGKYAFLKADELSIPAVPYTGNQLRIDGYYYQLVDGVLYHVNCFYSNGVLQHLGGYKMSDIKEYERIFTTKEFNEKGKKSRFFWGAFKIEGSQIRFEKWYPSEVPKAYVRAGNILNDTTFIITEIYRMKDGKKTEVRAENETYHFRQFSPKPDSTNAFVP